MKFIQVRYNGTDHECTNAAKKLLEKTEECLTAKNEEICRMEGEIIHTQTISAQSQNEFLGDLELSGESKFEAETNSFIISDPESLEEGGDGGDTLDSSDMNVQESLDPMDESIDDEDDESSHIVSNNNYQNGSGALDG